ncbi:MAG: cyclic-di-AMP receptor [Anaerolineales bacterium]|nr:cyclic-di-AMP receptor [Anaerolineales bacterium]MCS7247195.1 cyclic-di-AMP receptor [Anaerolineales bacterium]MDW8161006.1 cyclic-di-AMP receptor [Anaerolineales bacterium]MDW8447139.1 cyclic-di-AMP receptor [Anaerolineales bacterium]
MNSSNSPLYLAIAIVQSQDEKAVSDALQRAGFEGASIATYGAWLGRRNSTLLIRVPAPQIQAFLEIMHAHCHQRTEYIATPIEGTAALPVPLSTPITIGGATIFLIPIEFYEEL